MYSDKLNKSIASAAMKVMEDTQQIDELSTNKMLNYRIAAVKQLGKVSPEKEEKRKAGIGASGAKIKAMVTKEEVELTEHTAAFAKEHGFTWHRSTYGAEMKHPEKGSIEINRYGEWKHSKDGKMVKHGQDQSSLEKHLSSVKEEVELEEALKGKQKVLDKNQNGKLDSQDFKILRKEESEQIDEVFPGTPEYEKKFGKVPQDLKKGQSKKTSQGELTGTGKGVVHKRKFSEMLDVYANGNLKSLFEALDDKEEIIVEEPTNDEFKAELKKAIDKSLGKDKAKVAEPAVQAVEVQKEEVELEERQLSSDEKSEMEKNVKGMKKNLQGFKDRYGDRAKEVMYATATKQAKGE